MLHRKRSPGRDKSFFAEPLEARRLLSQHAAPVADVDDQSVQDADAVSLTVLANAQSAAKFSLRSVPQLSSDPGAPVSLYLNFLGASAMTWESYSVPATPAYDQDGDPTTFSSSELTSINDIWEEVSESYSPFNINVTTVAPASLIHGQNLEVIIGGSGAWLGSSSGGISYIGAFTSVILPNISFVFSGNLADGSPKYVGDAAAHEAGHQFGLSHQAVWSGNTLLDDYNPGTLDNGPIMGNAYSDTRALWYDGVNDASPTTIQNDMAIIASPTNGVTYRDDGISHSIFSPTPINSAASGILSTTSQVDYYKFTTAAGTVSLSASQFSIPDVYDGMLKLKFSLFNSSGQLVVSSNAGLTESLQAAVAAGTYTLAVSSDGAYGDVGQYTVSESGVASVPVVPSSLAAVATSSASIHLSWADSTGDETGFYIERSSNDSTWTQIASTSLTGYDDTGLADSTTYYYRIRAFNGNGDSLYTPVVSATTIVSAPRAPSQLLASPVSTTQISLSWVDGSNNEAGFDIERSPDDSHWTQIDTTAANATSFTNSGLNPATLYYYRIRAFNAGGNSDYSNIGSASTLVAPPSVPTALLATASSSTEIDLTWTDNSNQSGFYIQRSTDNANWSQISSTATSSYQDTGLAGGTTYYYRICAYNTGGDSSFTSSVHSTTLSTATDTPTKLVIANQPIFGVAGDDLSGFSVAVEDAGNHVVTNNTSSISVALSQNSTNATLVGSQTERVVSGVAVFSDLNLTKAGNYTLVFTDASLTSAVSSQFAISSGPVSQLIFDSSIPSAAAGAVLPAISVDVEDQYGNLVTAPTSVSLSSSPVGLQVNTTSVNGVATFTGVALSQGGQYSLMAADGSISSAPSNIFTITSPPPPAYLYIAQQPASGMAGSPLTPIKVQVFDQNGNLATSVDSSIAISLNDGPGGATFTATSSDIVNGEATFSNISLTTAGAYTLVATDGDLVSATTATITVAPAPAVKMVFVAQPTDTSAGSNIAPIAVALEDEYGNIASNNSSSVKLQTAENSAAFVAPIQNGIATFSTISFTQTGMQGFTALDGTLPAINSSNFNITPAVPASFKIISPSGSSIAGQDLSTVTVEVKDQFGNAVSQSPVSVSIASGPNFANLSGTLTTSTDANGIATFSDLSLDRAGTYTLGFVDESIPATSVPFQIVYAGPQLVFDSEPTNIAAGGKMPKLSIAADDTRGNLLSKTAKVKVSLSISDGGKIIGNATATIKKGIARFNTLSIQKAGTYTLQATASGFGTAYSNSFTVSAGAISKLSFLSQPASSRAGEPLNAAVSAVDRYGNGVSNITASLALGVHPAIANFNTSAEIIDGEADFSDIGLGTPGVYTLIATGSGAKVNSKRFLLS